MGDEGDRVLWNLRTRVADPKTWGEGERKEEEETNHNNVFTINVNK